MKTIPVRDLVKEIRDQKIHALEDELAKQLDDYGIKHEREYKLPKKAGVIKRNFVYDFFIAPELLIEVQGGTWAKTKGAHSSGTGIRRDCEKLIYATTLRYRQFSVTSDMVKKGEAINAILKFLGK